FGTARIYINKKSGSVVANCHKIPAKEFNHKILSVDEIVDKYNLLINKLLQLNANLKIVFTVSPIRHWKDGAQGNQLSKSILFVAIHEIIKNNPACTYFPAYEIMMDDLRDYRFYEADMLHPNQMAVDYIWDKFSEIYLDEKAKKLLPEIMNIINALNHKPFNTNTNEFKKFIENNLKIINSIKEKHPEIDFQKEINYFKSFV
ncbi:MAG: GSCFA domain-containing protein, partial [Bacteroidales bacterium]|nr:GSCFA domain-containing protein [Bacteroidales bacterium]